MSEVPQSGGDSAGAPPVDLGFVTRVCICGSDTWKILASFDEDHEIATYSTEMYCSWCGAKAETPLPINKPDLP